MDLLQGYGSSSDSDNDSVSSCVQSTPQNQTAAAAAPPPPAAAKLISKPTVNSTKRGKRILSLGAVLPPEIFDRLTRPEGKFDDSSTSSFEGEIDKRGGLNKRKRAPKIEDDNDNDIFSSRKIAFNHNRGGADRTELNSFLSELRATRPMEKSADTKSKSDSQQQKCDKLGMAFMSYTETKHNSNEVVDVHAAKPPSPQPNSLHDSSMQRKAAAPSLSFARISVAAPVSNVSMLQNPTTTNCNVPEYHVPKETPHISGSVHTNTATSSLQQNYNSNNTLAKSRKQKREEERALRSGEAFQNRSATTEIHQPSPTEFAPTAHAAAIASNAARYRGLANVGGGGGGSASVKSIAMYDPQSGGDVKGLGITGKHRSKHQINSLMANAISLEAHRAAEAELARFGGGQQGSNSRADAKRKYGW